MPNLGEAYVEITGRNRGLLSSLTQSKTATGQAVGGMQGAVDKMASATGARMAAWATGIGAAIAAAFTVKAIVNFGREAVAAWGEQEDALDALASALRASGTYSDAAMKRFEAFGTEMQNVTIYSDELIQSSMALARNIGVPTARLEEATKAAIGLAAAYGLDLNSSMRLVARASQGATAMLGRMGIVLDENLSPQEKFNELLRRGNALFGVAEARAKTTTGSLTQLKNQYGELLETVGRLLAPAITDLTARMKAYINQTNVGIANTGALQAKQQAWADTVNYLVEAFSRLGKVLQIVFLGISTPIILAITAFRTFYHMIRGDTAAIEEDAKRLDWLFAKMATLGKAIIAPWPQAGKVTTPTLGVSGPGAAGGGEAGEEGKVGRIAERGYQVRLRKATEIRKLEMERNKEMAGKEKDERVSIWADYADRIASLQADQRKKEYDAAIENAKKIGEAQFAAARDSAERIGTIAYDMQHRKADKFRQLELERDREAQGKGMVERAAIYLDYADRIATLKTEDRREQSRKDTEAAREGWGGWVSGAVSELERRREAVRFTGLEEAGRGFRVRAAQAAFAVPPEMQQVQLAQQQTGYLRQLVELGRQQVATLETKLAQLDQVLTPGYY